MAGSTLIIICAINFAILELVSAQCTTPSGSDGDCKVIGECQPVLDYIKNAPKPLNNEAREYLRKLQCGFGGNNVKVCCDRERGGNGDSGEDILDHQNVRLLPQSCGISVIENKIFNGNITSLFEYPWMALLSYKTDRGLRFLCGGSLINDQYVLTAAHCINSRLAGVRLGEFDITKNQDCEKYPEGDTVCAPAVQDFRIVDQRLYSSTFSTGDIALLRLHRRVKYTDAVRPICLPLEPAVRNLPNRKFIVTGWGRTEKGQGSDVLLQVEVPKVPINDCKRAYRTYNLNVTERHFCAGDHRDSCSGDSGGPLQVIGDVYNDARFVQYGIVSFGSRFCGTPGLPGVYTYVTSYLKWILDNIRP